MPSRLTPHEIDRALGRIRAEYDHYIVHFLKTPDAKKQFEERYAEALRARMDLTRFLAVEMDVVRTLVQKAADDKQTPMVKPPRAGSYADQVIERLRARIKDYPALGLPEHPEKSPDVDKLYGALRWFRKEVWDVLYPVLLGKAPHPLLFQCDAELGSLTLQGENWPKEVEAYWALLNGRAEMSLVARAQNRCLLIGGQLIHRLEVYLAEAQGAEALAPAERDDVAKARAFCERVLADFRLRELVVRS